MNKKKARKGQGIGGLKKVFKVIWFGYERLFDCHVVVLCKHQKCDTDNLSAITETSLSNFNMFK